MEHRLMIDEKGAVVLIHVRMPEKKWTKSEQMAQTSFTVQVLAEDQSPLCQATSPQSAAEARRMALDQLLKKGWTWR
ncbi:MAG: hypothetical protein AB7F75_04925 [Planctomycetota bacterium]